MDDSHFGLLISKLDKSGNKYEEEIENFDEKIMDKLSTSSKMPCLNELNTISETRKRGSQFLDLL